MKIIVNKCYGGYGINNLCLLNLIMAKAKCVKSNSAKGWGNTKFPVDLGNGYYGCDMWAGICKDDVVYTLNKEKSRIDPVLIDMIESGMNCNGSCAHLQITEIPDGISWEIDEYDGIESIHEKHRSW